MKDRIARAYPHRAGAHCIAEHTTSRRIFDSPAVGKCVCRTGKQDSDLDFEIKNRSGRTYYTLAVDGCLYLSDGPRRCDCAVFWDDTIVFIEFKLGMPVGKRRKLSERIREAVKQLVPTIERFVQHQIILDTTTVEAVAFVSRHHTRPAHTIAIQNAIDKIRTAIPAVKVRFKVTKSRTV